MRSLVPALSAAALIVVVGVYHGRTTDRWSDPSADDHPGKRIAAMNLAFGDWHGEILPRDATDDPKTSVLHCRFTHSKSGKWFLTAVTSGRPGRVAVHNPEHCYLGSGYKVVDSIRRHALPLPDGDAQFWTGHFQKKRPTGLESIRIYWGWTHDGRWTAPTYPRFEFASRRTLHKLYFIHAVAGAESEEDRRLYEDFMQQYVRELNKHIDESSRTAR